MHVPGGQHPFAWGSRGGFTKRAKLGGTLRCRLLSRGRDPVPCGAAFRPNGSGAITDYWEAMSGEWSPASPVLDSGAKEKFPRWVPGEGLFLADNVSPRNFGLGNLGGLPWFPWRRMEKTREQWVSRAGGFARIGIPGEKTRIPGLKRGFNF